MASPSAEASNAFPEDLRFTPELCSKIEAELAKVGQPLTTFNNIFDMLLDAGIAYTLDNMNANYFLVHPETEEVPE